MSNIPIVGNDYNCFDDGKVRESRRYRVHIEKIIPFQEIDNETLAIWRSEVKTCNWLYAKSTDSFVIGKHEDGNKEIFVRTVDGGWFSIGGFLVGGRLDIDGSLLDQLST